MKHIVRPPVTGRRPQLEIRQWFLTSSDREAPELETAASKYIPLISTPPTGAVPPSVTDVSVWRGRGVVHVYRESRVSVSDEWITVGLLVGWFGWFE